MIKKRLLMGAIAVAAVAGLATGPMAVGAAGAAANPDSVQRSFNVNCPNCVNVQGNLHWNGSGNLTISFRDVGQPGDSFRATYVDNTATIVGKCAVSSRQYFYKSLTVHIPTTRNFKIRIRWCSGSGNFPAGGQMLLTP